MRNSFLLALVVLAVAGAGPVQGSGLLGGAVNPVLNGGFELRPPEEASAVLQGSAADACIGLGHQVFYGTGTLQQKAENAALAAGNPPDGSADVGVVVDHEAGSVDVLAVAHVVPDRQSRDQAEAAAAQVQGDPDGEALFLAGVGHCVFSGAEGTDVVWVGPVDSVDKAAHWSVDTRDPATVFADVDADGDREAFIANDPSNSGHNLWQAFPSPHQAFSGDFDALVFRLGGAKPASALVQLSFSSSPAETQHPFVGLFLECQLTFRSSILAPGPGGLVAADPVNAQFTSASPECNEAKAAWDAGSAAERRDVLGRLRIVQLSFWGWNTGPTPVTIDDVGLAGATLAAEQVAAGNVDVDEPQAPEVA